MRENVLNQVQESIDFQGLSERAEDLAAIPDVISALNISTRDKVPETKPGPYLVQWQRYPFFIEPKKIFVKNNMLAVATNRNAYSSMQINNPASLRFGKLLPGIKAQIFKPIFVSGKTSTVIWAQTFW